MNVELFGNLDGFGVCFGLIVNFGLGECFGF